MQKLSKGLNEVKNSLEDLAQSVHTYQILINKLDELEKSINEKTAETNKYLKYIFIAIIIYGFLITMLLTP